MRKLYRVKEDGGSEVWRLTEDDCDIDSVAIADADADADADIFLFFRLFNKHTKFLQ